MRNNYDRGKIIEYLSEKPFLSYACKKAGIARATVHRWMKDNVQFRKEIEAALKLGRSNMCDVAEAQLYKKITEGDFNSIKFYLQNNDYRYISKNPVKATPPPNRDKRGEVVESAMSASKAGAIAEVFKRFYILEGEMKARKEMGKDNPEHTT